MRIATTRPNAKHLRAMGVGAVALAAVATGLTAAAGSVGASSPAPIVTGLSLRSGGTWGGDTITIRGTGFAGHGSRAMVTVLFGRHRADSAWVLNDGAVQANSPEVRNRRATVDVRVVLRDGTKSAITSADRFTFVVPTRNTPMYGGWSANQSRAVANSMIRRAKRVNDAAVAHNPGYWTPAMGRSAVRRAAAWVGMPYTWAGGTYTGPSYGVCYGDGLIGKFDCTFRGFDCSGLTLYAWGRYRHLDHFAATQRRQAGRFHPALSELQPGDLMFFGGGSSITHVVMYAGGGRIVQAAQSGYPVRYDAVDDVLAWEPRYFGATRPTSKGRQGSGPTITSISTATSATGGGATVTIRGTHLDTTSAVLFGGRRTYAFNVRSAGMVTVTVPAHAAGRVSVRIGNAWGVSPVSSRAVMQYVAAPTVTSIAPATGDPAGGTAVTVNGTDFVPGTGVTLDGVAITPVTVVSRGALSVVMPAHAAGRVTLRVTTPYGTSNGVRFRYDTPSPGPSTPVPTPTG